MRLFIQSNWTILALILLINCSGKEDVKEIKSTEYRDITDQFSLEDFEKIKQHIIDQGEFEPFFNLYVHQPIYHFTNFTATILPEIGALNRSCDPSISDFNQLVIFDSDLTTKYMYFLRIRSGEFEKPKIQIPDYEGLQEERVYLLSYPANNLDSIADRAIEYIEQIKIQLP